MGVGRERLCDRDAEMPTEVRWGVRRRTKDEIRFWLEMALWAYLVWLVAAKLPYLESFPLR